MNLIKLTVEESTWFVGITPLAMTCGVLISIPTSEKLGRKKIFSSQMFSQSWSTLLFTLVQVLQFSSLAEVSSALGWVWVP